MILWALVAQVLDSLSFLLVYSRYGYVGEALPFPVLFYDRGGISGILVMKAFGVVWCTLLLLWLYKREDPKAVRLGHIGAWVVLGLGVMGIVINTWSWSL